MCLYNLIYDILNQATSGVTFDHQAFSDHFLSVCLYSEYEFKLTVTKLYTVGYTARLKSEHLFTGAEDNAYCFVETAM
jgi:hypothetical protein